MFCGDLLRMYTRYARRKNWQTEVLDQREDGKALRQATLLVRGRGARALLGEGGGHSIQHLTRSRRQDRIHTSTVTVAVFALAEMARPEQALNMREVRVDTFRGSGKGGQHRNVTDSAVRAVHEPSGEIATVTSGRSQGENRQRALQVLAARVQARADTEHERGQQQRRRQQTRANKAQAIRVYDQIRDMVRCGDGRKIKNVKRVLDGDLDALVG